MVAGTLEIDTPLGGISLQGRPVTTTELERNTPVLSRVVFQSEDNIEVEDISESVEALNSPLSPDHPDVFLYIGTPTRSPSSPGLHTSIPSMTTVVNMASTMSVVSMQTPISVQ